MTRWHTGRAGRGVQIQSAVPSALPTLRSMGLTLRGVVVAAYVYDSETFWNQEDTPNDIYVDVLTYGRFNTLIPRVLWTQGRGGIQEGEVRLPRVARQAVPELPLDDERSMPQTMDGDHVIVGFLENDLNQPYVANCIHHPSSDIGNAGRPLPQRLRLVEADGSPRLWKHSGTGFGVLEGGDFVVDTRRAHPGHSALLADGSEPEPSNDGTHGNIVVDVQRGATVTLRIGDGETLRLTNQDGEATLQSGDGSVSVAVAQHLQRLYENLQRQFDQLVREFNAHIHTSAAPGSPTSPPATPSTSAAPAWDSNIVSDKVTLSDTG